MTIENTHDQRPRPRQARPVRCIALAFQALAGPDPRPNGSLAARALRNHQIPVTPEFPAVFDRRVQAMARRSSTVSLAEALRRAIRDARMPEPGTATLSQLVRAIFAGLPDPHINEHAARTVRALHRQDWHMVLTCRSPRPADVRVRTLNMARIAGCFSAIVMPTDYGAAPPQPDYYRHVRDASGRQATDMLWVGPDIERDVRQPQRHKMQAALLTGAGDITDLPDGALTLTSVRELPDLLTRLQTSRRPNGRKRRP